jgi:hypothetical protein
MGVETMRKATKTEIVLARTLAQTMVNISSQAEDVIWDLFQKNHGPAGGTVCESLAEQLMKIANPDIVEEFFEAEFEDEAQAKEWVEDVVASVCERPEDY